MKIPKLFVLFVLLSTFCLSVNAAVTCVLDKETGKFESSAAKRSANNVKSKELCDTAAATDTLQAVQHAINDAGSKLVNASVLVNTEKLPVPEPRAASANKPEKPPEPERPNFNIKKGQPIHTALEEWAKASRWTLEWYPVKSWKAISDVDMNHHSTVDAAVVEVVNILRNEGKPVQWRVSEGNKVIEILSTEVKHD